MEETANNTELLASAERVDVIRLTSVLPASPYDLNGRIHSNQLGQLAIHASLTDHPTNPDGWWR